MTLDDFASLMKAKHSSVKRYLRRGYNGSGRYWNEREVFICESQMSLQAWLLGTLPVRK